MKELNRFPVENSDVWLIHAKDDDGEEAIWAVLCPEPEGECDPSACSESFIVATGDDAFIGLEQLQSALARCAKAVRP